MRASKASGHRTGSAVPKGGPWKYLLVTLVPACTLALPPPPEEEPPGKRMLLQAGDLLQSLKDPGLRVLDVRKRADYLKGHVPGARWVDVVRWQELGKAEGGFRNAQAWGERVSELGLEEGSRVVVYGTSLPDTARIWWMLKYAGLEEVMLLDGGWEAWRKAGGPVEPAVPAVTATRFVPKFDAGRLAEMEPLKTSLRSGSLKVVDARSKDEFTGKEVRGKRGGHISGATHLEWKELLDAEGRFQPPDRLRLLFRERGLLPTETVACY